MSRRLLVAAAILVGSFSSLAIGEASAQDRVPSLLGSKVSFLPSDATAPIMGLLAAESAAPVAAPATPAAVDTPQFPSDLGRSALGGRSKGLLPIYAATAVMQALDVHSTMQVLNRGGGEGNPMLQGLVSNKPAFMAAKAAVAASTIYAASRIARHSKIGAIVTLVGLNSIYAMVISHNYKLANSMR
jgi:hypothetical protein